MVQKSSEVNLRRYGVRKDVLVCKRTNDSISISMSAVEKNCEVPRGIFMDECLDPSFL